MLLFKIFVVNVDIQINNLNLMKKFLFLSLIGLAFLLAGCSLNQNQNQSQPTPITYTDQANGYQIKLPSNWNDYRVVNGAFQLPTNNESWYELDTNGNKVYGYGTVFTIKSFSLTSWNQMRQNCGAQGSSTWSPDCYEDDRIIGQNNTSIFIAEWPNSGPNVGGDTQWGNLKNEILDSNFDGTKYLKDNFSIIN